MKTWVTSESVGENVGEKSANCLCGIVKNVYLCNMDMNKDLIRDEVYGDRLLISVRADQTELIDNIRVARNT